MRHFPNSRSTIHETWSKTDSDYYERSTISLRSRKTSRRCSSPPPARATTMAPCHELTKRFALASAIAGGSSKSRNLVSTRLVIQMRGPGAPISVEEHTSKAPRPRRQSQNPPLQKSSAIPALPWPSKPRLRYSPGLAPTTRLNALLNAASDS